MSSSGQGTVHGLEQPVEEIVTPGFLHIGAVAGGRVSRRPLDLYEPPFSFTTAINSPAHGGRLAVPLSHCHTRRRSSRVQSATGLLTVITADLATWLPRSHNRKNKLSKGKPRDLNTPILNYLMKIHQPLLILLAFLAAMPFAHAQSKPKSADYVGQLSAKLEPTRVEVYKKVGPRELRLNIFEPEGHQATDRRACFVTIHGGGWTGLEPRRQYSFAAHFAGLGMLAISVEYRLVKPDSGTTVADCVKDGRSAVRYVRAHAAQLGIDPQKIVANGGSAGGHIAAGTALFEGVDEAGEDTSVSSVPNALVLFFPVIDTSQEGYGNKKIGTRWQDISPLHRVRAGTPPTLILHGTGDTVTPFKGAQAFRDAMLKAGNRCDLVVNEGGAHGYLMRDAKLYEQALRNTETFLVSLGFLPRGGAGSVTISTGAVCGD